MNLFDLSGKTAIVTGASSGIGRRMAQCLSENGAQVILIARNIDRLNEVASLIESKGAKAFVIPTDLTDIISIRSTVNRIEELGLKIDILVNNAGIGKVTPLFDQDDSDMESIFRTNLFAIWDLTKLIASHMKQNKIAGSIINISSINGLYKFPEHSSLYGSSKAAVIQMSRILASELAKENIRINVIAPGLIHTPLTDHRLDSPAKKKEWEERIPVGFIADPSDLDGVLLFIASNKASRYVTGEFITVDGGITWKGI